MGLTRFGIVSISVLTYLSIRDEKSSGYIVIVYILILMILVTSVPKRPVSFTPLLSHLHRIQCLDATNTKTTLKNRMRQSVLL